MALISGDGFRCPDGGSGCIHGLKINGPTEIESTARQTEQSSAKNNSSTENKQLHSRSGGTCPEGYFRPVIAKKGIQLNKCVCFDEGIAYNGNNVVLGKHNKRQSRYDCQQSCAKSDSCKYWTWLPPATNNRTDYKRRCYLKSKRENFIQSSEYVSGSKNCRLPEAKIKRWT